MAVAMTRRQLLFATAAAACVAGVAGPIPLRAEAAMTAEVFLALSRSLTGRADLDDGVGAALLEGFVATGRGAALAGLAAGGETAANHPLANAVVAAWYSGLAPDGKSVATFDQALLWSALSFTKPFGSCGGATGYWADPPG